MSSRLLCAAALALLATLTPLSAQDGSKRALRVLEDPGADTGSLRLLGGLRVGSTAAGARGLVEVLVPVTRELRAAPNAGFQVTLVLARIDEQPVVLTEEVPTQSLAEASASIINPFPKHKKRVQNPKDENGGLVLVTCTSQHRIRQYTPQRSKKYCISRSNKRMRVCPSLSYSTCIAVSS